MPVDIYPRNLIPNHRGSKAILFPAEDFTDNLLNLFLFYPVHDSVTGSGRGYGAGYAYLCIRYHNVTKNSFEGAASDAALESKTGLSLSNENVEFSSVLCDAAETFVSYYFISKEMTASLANTEGFLYATARALILYSFDENTVKFVEGKPYVYSLLQTEFKQFLFSKNGRVYMVKWSDFKIPLDLKKNSEENEYSESDPVPMFARVAQDFIKIEAAKLISRVEGIISVTYPGFHPAILEGTVAIFSKDDDMYFGIIANSEMNFVANSSPSTTFGIQNIKSLKNMLRLSNRDCSVFQDAVDIPPFVTRATQIFSSGFDWRKWAIINFKGFVEQYYISFSLRTNPLVKKWFAREVPYITGMSMLTWMVIATGAKVSAELSSSDIATIQASVTADQRAALTFLWSKITAKSIRYLEPHIYFVKDSAVPTSSVNLTFWQDTIQPQTVFPDITSANFPYVLPRSFMPKDTSDTADNIKFDEERSTSDSLEVLYNRLLTRDEDPDNSPVFKEGSDFQDTKVTPFKFDTNQPVTVLANSLSAFIQSVRNLPPYRYNWWETYNKGKGYSSIKKVYSVDLRKD